MDADLRTATARDLVTDSEKMTLADVSDLIHLTVGGQDFVVSSSSAESGLSIFAVSGEALELRDTLGPKDGLWINGLEDIAALSAGGQSFIVGVSAGSSTLSAVRINPMGAMFVTDMAIDDRGSRFDDVIALDTFQTHGRSCIVTGGTDAGIALFELLPGGTLYHHHSTAQTLDWNIGSILSLQAVVTGDEVQVLASGAKRAGRGADDIAARRSGAPSGGNARGRQFDGRGGGRSADGAGRR